MYCFYEGFHIFVFQPANGTGSFLVFKPPPFEPGDNGNVWLWSPHLTHVFDQILFKERNKVRIYPLEALAWASIAMAAFCRIWCLAKAVISAA